MRVNGLGAVATICATTLVIGGCGTQQPFERGLPSGPGGGQSRALSFDGEIHDLLLVECASCHGGGAGGFTLSGDENADYAATLERIDPVDPEASLLLLKATGQGHGGGTIWSGAGDESYALVLEWIQEGAIR